MLPAVHPWFRPLYRRVGTLAVCLAWVAFEAWQGVGTVWFWIALGFSAYALTLFRPVSDQDAAG